MSDLSRKDWILEALRLMDAEGVHAVTIDRLAADLGVTKGSFYWHFESHADLMTGVLDYWSQDLLALKHDRPNWPEDPSELFLLLLERIAENALNEHDTAIRTWALFDPAVRKVVRSVEVERLAFVRGLLMRMGFDEAEATLRSRISYYYVVGEQVTSLDQTRAARMEHVRARHALLTAPKT